MLRTVEDSPGSEGWPYPHAHTDTPKLGGEPCYLDLREVGGENRERIGSKCIVYIYKILEEQIKIIFKK